MKKIVNNTQYREESEFNMAVSFLNRLNSILYICTESSIGLDIYHWYHALRALQREVITEMSEEEKKEINNTVVEINPLIVAYFTASKSDTSLGDESVPPDLYDGLHALEAQLRGVLKKSGLLTKMKSDPRAALGR